MVAESDSGDIALLKNLVPLNALSDEHLGQLISRIKIEQAKKGDILFREGDSDHQHFYLLEGEVALLAGNRELDVVQGGAKTARFALAHQWPRKFSGRAVGDVRFARIESQLISDLLMRTQAQSYRVSELDGNSDGDWVSQVLRSRVLQQIPPSNIQNVLRRMEEVSLHAGEVLIRRGDPGDYYYVIVQGTCVVTRSGAATDPQLAVLGPGDCFGEEALVSGGTRSSTVTMGSDGTLMRLSKDDFAELIRRPLLRSVKMEAAKKLIEQGGSWIDIRPADAYAVNHLPGALSLPLQTLRARCSECSLETTYVVYGEHFSDCAVGAFLLRERGFDVWVLEDGAVDLDVHPVSDAQADVGPESAASAAASKLAPQHSQEFEQRLQEVQARYHKALFQRVAEIRQLRQMLDAANADRQRLEQSLQQAREENATLRSGTATTQGQADLERRITELQKELDDAQETIQDASTQESIFHWEHLRIQSRLESTVHALAEQHEANRALQEENEQLKRRLAALEGR
jgi:CRP-like cAMP-binding protein